MTVGPEISVADGDNALVLAARCGDNRAFSLLIERHRPALYKVCLRLSGRPELVEDACQEAALQAFLGLDRLRQPESFGAWFIGIGLNVYRHFLRGRAGEVWSWEAVMGGSAAVADDSWSPEEAVESVELAERVRDAVSALPERQRRAVLLFYWAGMTYVEAAEALGTEVSALKALLHRARGSLRRELIEVWKEENMGASAKDEAVEAQIKDVVAKPARGDATRHHVLLLEEEGGDRQLAIWVGEAEGAAIALQLEKIDVPRPLGHVFTAGVLSASGAALKEVRINRLAHETFYATAVIEGRMGDREVDARPSDALALALATGAPILVQPEVFDAAQAEEGSPTRNAFEGLTQNERGSAKIAAEVTARWPGFRRDAS